MFPALRSLTFSSAALVAASKQLGDSMKQTYEPDWDNSDELYSAIDGLDLMYSDVAEKVGNGECQADVRAWDGGLAV